jgi:hypothetical protein
MEAVMFMHLLAQIFDRDIMIYTHQAQGGAFVQTKRREVHVSHFLDNTATEIITGGSDVFEFLLSGFCMPERPPKGTAYSNYNIPLQDCCTEHSQLLRS